MRAGRMDKRVIIEYRVITRSSIGEESVVWTTEDTVWADIDPVTSTKREFLSMQQVQSEVTHMVTIRYRHGMNHNKRFRYGRRILNINSVVNQGEEDRFLVCFCAEELLDAVN